MSPYNMLSDIKSGRIQVKSMDSATILFFKCRRWEYNMMQRGMQVFFMIFINLFINPLSIIIIKRTDTLSDSPSHIP